MQLDVDVDVVDLRAQAEASICPHPGASTEGKVDATCVQIGLRGEENYTLKGEEFPQIYG